MTCTTSLFWVSTIKPSELRIQKNQVSSSRLPANLWTHPLISSSFYAMPLSVWKNILFEHEDLQDLFTCNRELSHVELISFSAFLHCLVGNEGSMNFTGTHSPWAIPERRSYTRSLAGQCGVRILTMRVRNEMSIKRTSFFLVSNPCTPVKGAPAAGICHYHSRQKWQISPKTIFWIKTKTKSTTVRRRAFRKPSGQFYIHSRGLICSITSVT